MRDGPVWPVFPGTVAGEKIFKLAYLFLLVDEGGFLKLKPLVFHEVAAVIPGKGNEGSFFQFKGL